MRDRRYSATSLREARELGGEMRFGTKKVLLVTLAVILVFPGLWGQTAPTTSVLDLTPLNADMNTIFTGIGHDLLPALGRTAISGNDIVGAAELKGFSGAYVAIAGLSLQTMDGAAKVLNDPNQASDTWKFTLLPIPATIKSFTTDIASYYNLITQRAFALPSVRIGVGTPLPFGFELLANGVFLPPQLVDTIKGLDSSGMVSKLGPTLDFLTVGGVLRKVVLSEKKKGSPSLSLGLGYVYSHYKLGVSNFSLDSLMSKPLDVAGFGTLGINGKVGFAATTNAYGAVFGLSKTLFIFRPFLKAQAYYHESHYVSEFEVNAKVSQGSTVLVEQGLSAPVDLWDKDLSFAGSVGFELALPVIVLSFSVSADMERPIAVIGTLDELKLNGVGANIGLRLQF